jgi:hypothetical protein
MVRPTTYTDEVLDKLAESLEKWAREGLRKTEFRLLSDWSLENMQPSTKLFG